MKHINHIIPAAIAIFFAATACTGSAGGSLPRAEKEAAVTEAVDAFISATQTIPEAPAHITLHSIMLLQHGQVIEERWMNGAGPEIPHVMHSVSKTFTSAAIGMAVGEGKLSVDDKVISFFPDKLPAEIPDNLAEMSIRDLLTMTCGHAVDCNPRTQPEGTDWVTHFLAHPVPYAPGEHFLYNSTGSYMLCAIFRQVMGVNVIDYLDEHLFKPLAIERPEWELSPQSINCGGWGLQLKTEDMAKMGQLLLQGGEWNGTQILPSEWVSEMTRKQVFCYPGAIPFDQLAEHGITTETSDWMQGYGYQMWMCRHGACRADGQDGQYIIVLPEKDAVIVLTTDSTMYQEYLNIVWEYLLPAFG